MAEKLMAENVYIFEPGIKPSRPEHTYPRETQFFRTERIVTTIGRYTVVTWYHWEKD